MAKSATKAEFGDFQTPLELTTDVCKLLARRKVAPASILEPTCGKGTFLQAALAHFPDAARCLGFDINDAYVKDARSAVGDVATCTVAQADFFSADWKAIIGDLPEPTLVIGNPPWVTNAELGTLKSTNLPEKTNFQQHRGFDAITGKANFDISEWMLIRMVEWFRDHEVILAMLCKSAVARKVLTYGWKHGIPISASATYRIDTLKHFGASVDGCLLVARSGGTRHSYDCKVYDTLAAHKADHTVGYRDDQLVADVSRYDRAKHLQGVDRIKWRSGVKHDCSKVMELTKTAGGFANGLGEEVELEDSCVFPMFKSSDVAKQIDTPRRWMIVTQQSVGEDTSSIEQRAPKTWDYLIAHAGQLDRRGSSIYKNRPRFSVFGVGPYTFTSWKVAISGFYKALDFRVIGPYRKRPVVFDDTVYFIPCNSQKEAEYIGGLLNSATAQDFFSAFTFWDNKRPVTVDLLRRLDLLNLAAECGSEERMQRYLDGHTTTPPKRKKRAARQSTLLPGP